MAIQNPSEEMQAHFDGLVYPFEPQFIWADGTFDHPHLLIEALKNQTSLNDFADDNGNMQSAVRLDNDPDNVDGIWVTVPKSTKKGHIEAAVAQYPKLAEEFEAAIAEAAAEAEAQAAK